MNNSRVNLNFDVINFCYTRSTVGPAPLMFNDTLDYRRCYILLHIRTLKQLLEVNRSEAAVRVDTH